ncbi:hypothetical protein GQ457_02G036950 [Hibiscus cannabinus]
MKFQTATLRQRLIMKRVPVVLILLGLLLLHCRADAKRVLPEPKTEAAAVTAASDDVKPVTTSSSTVDPESDTSTDNGNGEEKNDSYGNPSRSSPELEWGQRHVPVTQAATAAVQGRAGGPSLPQIPMT